MKSILFRILIVIITGLSILGIESCNSGQHEHSAAEGKYTCPMHPQVVQDAPGTCPICKMDLVAVNGGGAKGELALNASQVQLANIRTIRVGTGNFSSSKILNGRLVANAKQTEVISSRFEGRVERLYVKETGVAVKPGQPLMQVYSEQLQVLQQEYLLQLKQVAAFPEEKIYKTLRDAAKNKLELFGYSAAQIAQLRRSNKISPYVTVFADASGVVNEVSVSEGQYVAEGTAVVRLQAYNRLWLEAEVYPSELGQVKVGSPIRVVVNGFPDREMNVKVDFVSPQLDPQTQLLTVRATISNESGLLQPGMQANVFLTTGRVTDAVSLPLDAVIRDEDGALVWIKKEGNIFVPRKVVTGAEDDRQIVITSGIADGEEVVTSGAYLLSSEFILKKGANPLSAVHH
ncbi:efflux RND transporter periplasmic adaptor subunit [Pedobacter sp. SYSU D00535]|uniref:efflux RND transporter periplasmic adaptor subunit n=1 Tax=Pedobacter sp. SYSU D00535 TaxID=2810308 RepID=UPI001A95884A|nr:efflux RND transporter periplasmic adaptor subunit [Pedobacter sp. SYSU D00535]